MSDNTGNEKTVLSGSVNAWRVISVFGSHPPMVELTASTNSDLPEFGAAYQGHMATTVAIQMDARAAIELYGQIGELIRSMGWQPPRSIEPQV